MWRWVNRRLIILIVEGTLLHSEGYSGPPACLVARSCRGVATHSLPSLFHEYRASRWATLRPMLFLFMISLGWAGGIAELPEGPPPTVDELRGALGDVPALPPEDTVVTRIAFGSCLGQGEPAPIFETILERQPRMMVMLGDNVYGDDKTGDPSLPMLRAAYGQLAQNPHFRTFAASVPVVPMWDDHDFGLNDAGGEFPFKAESERIFEAFWGVDAEDPRPVVRVFTPATHLARPGSAYS